VATESRCERAKPLADWLLQGLTHVNVLWFGFTRPNCARKQDSWQANGQARDAGSSEFPVPFVKRQRKAITFVGYGGLGAARAIETLWPNQAFVGKEETHLLGICY